MKYDVFISYKHSDKENIKTKDFMIANELYNELIKKGINTFFSVDSLEKMGISRYKSEIDEALDSAKVLIVVLTKAEYAESQWVHYEWDSFYNDYLSGYRSNIRLFTLTDGVDLKKLPRTLRNMQNFDYNQGIDNLNNFIHNYFEQLGLVSMNRTESDIDDKYTIVTGKSVTLWDISQTVVLDKLTYGEEYLVTVDKCLEWFSANPDIYVMIRDNEKHRLAGYINACPISDEYYETIKNGDFSESDITSEIVLNYDMPYAYSLYFFSIVVHPEYRNSDVFFYLFNAVIEKFIRLSTHEVYIKRMLADAVTPYGEKFCKMFGMKKITQSTHNSTLYEVSLIPPEFRKMSKKTKQLFDFYKKKYEDEPYLFE